MDTIERVRAMLKSSKKSMRVFAEEIGFTPQHVERVLNRRAAMSPRMEQQMLRALESASGKLQIRMPDEMYEKLCAWAEYQQLTPEEFAKQLLVSILNMPKNPHD